MSGPRERPADHVQALMRGLRILEHVYSAGAPVAVREVAEALELNVSTAQQHPSNPRRDHWPATARRRGPTTLSTPPPSIKPRTETRGNCHNSPSRSCSRASPPRLPRLGPRPGAAHARARTATGQPASQPPRSTHRGAPEVEHRATRTIARGVGSAATCWPGRGCRCSHAAARLRVAELDHAALWLVRRVSVQLPLA